jgi:hypothetical protein
LDGCGGGFNGLTGGRANRKKAKLKPADGLKVAGWKVYRLRKGERIRLQTPKARWEESGRRKWRVGRPGMLAALSLSYGGVYSKSSETQLSCGGAKSLCVSEIRDRSAVARRESSGNTFDVWRLATIVEGTTPE